MEHEEERRTSPLYPTGGPQTLINRPTYNEEQFHSAFKPKKTPTPTTIFQKLKDKIPARAACKQSLPDYFPIVKVLKNYRTNLKDKIIGDLAGGLTTGIMTIPQGLAYARLAGVDPVHGLYTGIFPVLIYLLLGTSQHISMGVFAVITIMIGDAVSAELPVGTMENGTSSADPIGPIDVAISVGFCVGIIQLIFFIFRLGFITRFLSDAMVSGFTTGAAFHVGASQLRDAFGIEFDRQESPAVVPKTIYLILKNIADTNAATFLIALVTVIILVAIKVINHRYRRRLRFPIPGELIVVILGTGISYGGDFQENFNVTVVNHVESGIPLPPSLRFDLVGKMFATSHPYVIAIVSFALTMSLAKVFAKKFNYKVDSNQELLAYSTANIIGSFLSCLVSSGSLSRTAVYTTAGGKTILGSGISALLILVVVLVLAQLVSYLPTAVLSAIILIALRGLMVQFKDVKRLYRVSITDMLVWIVTWLATVFLAVDLGLAVGVGFSLLVIIYRTAWPRSAVLGRIGDTDLYRDSKRYDLCCEVPSVKIFRYEASLCFANVDSFRIALLEKTNIDLAALSNAGQSNGNSQSSSEQGTPPLTPSTFRHDAAINLTRRPAPVPVHTVVIDCTVFTYLDSLGVGLLIELTKDLEKVNVQMLLAGCRWRVREMLDQAGYISEIGASHLFVTTHDAVVFAQMGLSVVGRTNEDSAPVESLEDADGSSGGNSCHDLANSDDQKVQETCV
eukprot:m.222328 g.222328  ORF g.222328 m.222328 type:complete len:734 (+) comp39975_c2_seq1:84-2285(+)